MTVMGDAAMERFSDRGSISPQLHKAEQRKAAVQKTDFSYCGLCYILLYSALGSNP